MLPVWSFLVAGLSLVISALVAFSNTRDRRTRRKLDANRLLDQAWDEMGREQGTTTLSEPPSVHHSTQSGKTLELARRKIDEALRLDPKNPKALRMKAVYLVEKGKPDEALKLLARSTPPKEEPGPWLETLGKAHMAVEHTDQGLASLRRAVEVEPDHASFRNSLACALMEARKFDEAESEFREAIRLDPGLVGPYSNLGLLLIERGRPAEAKAQLTTALRLRPDSLPVQLNLGTAYVRLDRFKEAQRQFEMALDQDPCFALAHSNRGAVIMSRIGARELPPSNKAHEEILHCFHTAIDLDPHLVEAYLGLSKLHLVLDDPHSAISTLENAPQEVGADPRVHDLLSKARAAR